MWVLESIRYVTTGTAPVDAPDLMLRTFCECTSSFQGLQEPARLVCSTLFVMVSAQVDYELHPQHKKDAKEALPASLVSTASTMQPTLLLVVGADAAAGTAWQPTSVQLL